MSAGVCRVCGHTRESLQHFTECCFVGEIFLDFRKLVGVDSSTLSERERVRFDLFATLLDKKLEEGWVNLHLVLWKYTIAALVRVDTEGEEFDKHAVWRAAWARLHRKMLALQERKQTIALRRKARGEEPLDMGEWGAAMTPIARLDPSGKLATDKETVDKILKLGKK